MPNIFKRTLRKREEEAGTKKKEEPKKKEEGPSQADFLYGSSSDLKKKGKSNRPPQSKKW